MNREKPLYALASVLIFAGALTGCATFSKCGFSGCPGDAKITADVETRLRQDTATSPPNWVYVQTSDRVVYLSGIVDSRGAKEAAEVYARQAPGVTDVVNTIVGHTP
jgi:osmotically-inducible protein OsmY